MNLKMLMQTINSNLYLGGKDYGNLIKENRFCSYRDCKAR